MAAPDSLIVERPSSEIVVLKINRPQVRNALNLEVRTRLADEVTRCGADNAVRCVIVTGSDAVFAAGADIGEMAEAGPVEVMSRNVQKYWRALMECPKPLIAAVEGFALGGGLELALCADIIIAGEGAKLGLPEVKVGILPGGGGTQKLARLVGRHRAMLLIMTGKCSVPRRLWVWGSLAKSCRPVRRCRMRSKLPEKFPRCRLCRSCRSRKSSTPGLMHRSIPH
jgi:enoyl-CoA hydratase/carnithine racemase